MQCLPFPMTVRQMPHGTQCHASATKADASAMKAEGRVPWWRVPYPLPLPLALALPLTQTCLLFGGLGCTLLIARCAMSQQQCVVAVHSSWQSYQSCSAAAESPVPFPRQCHETRRQCDGSLFAVPWKDHGGVMTGDNSVIPIAAHGRATAKLRHEAYRCTREVSIFGRPHPTIRRAIHLDGRTHLYETRPGTPYLSRNRDLVRPKNHRQFPIPHPSFQLIYETT